MTSQGGYLANIIFRNQPKLSEYEIQQDFNERRLSLVPFIRDFLSNHDRFGGKEVNVTFSDKGVGSLISIIETESDKLVLKIPLSDNPSGNEGQFLRVWQQAGVKVPHVIEEGRLSDYAYILMEFINAPLLGQMYSPEEMTDKNIYREMGRTLRAMHIPEAEGYGHVIDNKAEYPTLNDWFGNPYLRKMIEYVEEQKLLTYEHGSLSEAFEALIEHVGIENKSSYCHNDFGSSNIFATNPITVFDPNPQFNNGYIDLGLSVVNHISVGMSPQQLIDGYFGGKPYNKKALQASILLNSYIKLPARYKKEKFDLIKNIQEYLIQTKHLLEV